VFLSPGSVNISNSAPAPPSCPFCQRLVWIYLKLTSNNRSKLSPLFRKPQIRFSAERRDNSMVEAETGLRLLRSKTELQKARKVRRAGVRACTRLRLRKPRLTDKAICSHSLELLSGKASRIQCFLWGPCNHVLEPLSEEIQKQRGRQHTGPAHEQPSISRYSIYRRKEKWACFANGSPLYETPNQDPIQRQLCAS
jgi:hypothetical protein